MLAHKLSLKAGGLNLETIALRAEEWLQNLSLLSFKGRHHFKCFPAFAQTLPLNVMQAAILYAIAKRFPSLIEGSGGGLL
jgi:hypothetical protein